MGKFDALKHTQIMAKKIKNLAVKQTEAPVRVDTLFNSSRKVDPALASLFAGSASNRKISWQHAQLIILQTLIQPIIEATSKATSEPTLTRVSKAQKDDSSASEGDESNSENESDSNHSGSEGENDESGSVSSHEEFEEATENTKSYRESSEEQVPQEVLEEAKSKSRRKRKRDDEDLEVNYMQRLAEEEAREDAKRDKERQPKRQKATEAAASNAAEINGVDGDSDAKMEDAESDEDEEIEVPKHESLTTTQTSEVEKANRTVFLGNVSAEAVTSKSAKKTLIQYMSSFLESMPKEKTLHKLASIRFRSTAYTNMLPKKASYVTQDLMESTTKSTNAYVVYTTKDAARKALTLNGTTVLGRHLRVDSVAHPAKIEPRKCVFVGNLGFVDDGSAVQAADDEESNKKRKSRKKEPSDIEEGLWREFGKCGTVENVRVVRDSKTRVGKGFAYIQFTVST
jgi:nucleolar protein 12